MTKDESTKFRFCYIDDEYLNYLRNPEIGDDKVPENEYETRKKFFMDTGFVKNGLRYFAPISSKVKLENDYEFRMLDEQGKKYVSAIKLNFMIPVPEGLYERLVMSSLNNNIKYKNLVSLELRFFNENKTAIQNLVNTVYNLDNPDHEHIIDFAKLEKAAGNFDVKAHIANKAQKKYKLTDNQIAKAQKLFDEKSKTDPSLTLDKVICIAIHNDKDNSFDPEIKAMVDKQMQMRVFYVKGKPTKLKEISSEYGITPEKCVEMKNVADSSKLDVGTVARSFVYGAKDGVVNKQAQSKVRAEVNTQREQRTENRQVSTQEKNISKPVTVKTKKSSQDQNSR